MTAGVLFWVIWILALIFGGMGVYRADANNRWVGGFSLAVWVEIGLLGWKVFGAPIQ